MVDHTCDIGWKCNQDFNCPEYFACQLRIANNRNAFKEQDAKAVEVEPKFAIVSDAEGFKFAEWRHFHGYEGWVYKTHQDFERCTLNCVAVYTNPVHCKQQLGKAQSLEKQLRPMWQAALEHAKKLEYIMLDAVYAIAKDNQIK